MGLAGEVRIAISITSAGDGASGPTKAATALDRLANSAERATVTALTTAEQAGALTATSAALTTELLKEHAALEQLGAEAPAIEASYGRIAAAQRRGVKEVEANIAAIERLRAQKRVAGELDVVEDRNLKAKVISLTAYREGLNRVGTFVGEYASKQQGATGATTKGTSAVLAHVGALVNMSEATNDATGSVGTFASSLSKVPGIVGMVATAISVVLTVGKGLADLFSAMTRSTIPEYARATGKLIQSFSTLSAAMASVKKLTGELKSALGGGPDLMGKALEVRERTARSQGRDDEADAIAGEREKRGLIAERDEIAKTARERAMAARDIALQLAAQKDELPRLKNELSLAEARQRAFEAQGVDRDNAERQAVDSRVSTLKRKVAGIDKTVSEFTQTLRELGPFLHESEQAIGALNEAIEDADVIKFEAIKDDKKGKGGGDKRKSDASEVAAEMKRDFEQRQREAQRQAEEIRRHEEEMYEFHVAMAKQNEALKQEQERIGKFAAEDEDIKRLGETAATVLDVTSALSSSVRALGTAFGDSAQWVNDFAGALGTVTSEFEAAQASFARYEDVRAKYNAGQAEAAEVERAYADAKTRSKAAIIGSVGALARAGAQQIKDERLRAGVLAVIELGMGLGKQFVPGLQDQAMGHFAAAATLGSVALFGGGGGGGGGSSKQPRTVARPLSEQTTSGQVTLNFNAPYIASGTVQETAAELSTWINRGASSGFS